MTALFSWHQVSDAIGGRAFFFVFHYFMFFSKFQLSDADNSYAIYIMSGCVLRIPVFNVCY